MTTEAPPKVNGMVEVRCTHTVPRGPRAGQLCGRLLAIVPSIQQLNGVRIPSCKGCGLPTQF